MDNGCIRLIVVSDIHYLSPALYAEGSAFQELMRHAAGQLIEYGDEIIAGLIAGIRREAPDAVLIPGDLTLNGEKESLAALFAKLAVLKEEGIRFFVIPGNHDIEHFRARSYFGDKAEPAEKITGQAFAEMAGPFGYDQALARDEDTSSYTAELAPWLWLLALDANTPEEPEVIPAGTLVWADRELEKAEQAGVRVIAMTHQNILSQHDLMKRQILNHEEVRKLLEKHQVRLNLSGHCHLQHVSRKEGFTDISTGCLSIWPLQYTVLTLSPDEADPVYEAVPLGILDGEGRERLDATVRGMVLPELAGKGIPADRLAGMLAFAQDLCADIFAGARLRFDPAGYPDAAAH